MTNPLPTPHSFLTAAQQPALAAEFRERARQQDSQAWLVRAYLSPSDGASRIAAYPFVDEAAAYQAWQAAQTHPEFAEDAFAIFRGFRCALVLSSPDQAVLTAQGDDIQARFYEVAFGNAAAVRTGELAELGADPPTVDEIGDEESDELDDELDDDEESDDLEDVDAG